MTARPDLFVIVGPTGAGKTSLAIALAEAIEGEVVSADSQQVYRGMDIGTGKATADEQARVPHHLLDIIDPGEEMTAQRFVDAADAAIADIRARQRPVVVAGGTMLYVRALLKGLFEGPAADPKLRAELKARAERDGVASLWAELQRVDAESAARIHDTDERRLIRALEVYMQSGTPLSEFHRRHQAEPPRYQAVHIGLCPERDDLYRRIDARVLAMIDAGLVDEVQGLRLQGFSRAQRSQQAIGYAELHAHLEGECDLPRAVELIQRNSRRYARRQLSWYRGQEEVTWYPDISAVDLGQLGRYLHH